MVQKTINLGIIFPEDTRWTGGLNYFVSLTSCLKYLNNSRFSYTIFASPTKKQFLEGNKIEKKNIIYSNFFNKYHLLNIIRKILLFSFKEDVILSYFLKKKKINIISHYKPIKGIKSVCWFPDFQHLYLKKNFSKKEINRRNLLYRDFADNAQTLLVSSQDSRKKLIKNYRNINKKRIEVLNFVPKLNFNKLNRIYIKKYKLNKRYLYIPNQFWPHKNHQILINCAKYLKKKNYYIQFVMTGDNSININYFNNFNKQIVKNKIQKYFKHLGMVSHFDVSKIIYNSNGVINPSFFEGWNTGVEEAKIFKKKLFLSNIEVHKEQCKTNVTFFNPNNSLELAKAIINSKNDKKLSLKKITLLYKSSRKLFSNNYFRILKKTIF